ncbi:MAG: hypothetical protein IKP35_00520 [Alphaproteobacteria bacterium]|nr:hypothetical protein [Alphaproteobacteria bacterium]
MINSATRLNIKILPDATTIQNIVNILESNKIPCQDFIHDSHCTIIYTPDIIKNVNMPDIKLPIIGTKAHFEFFDTQDDGIVLVIEFESVAAKKLFKYLKEKYKFTIKYNDFRPHITIQKNIPAKIKLPDIKFNLFFNQLIKEII